MLSYNTICIKIFLIEKNKHTFSTIVGFHKEDNEVEFFSCSF